MRVLRIARKACLRCYRGVPLVLLALVALGLFVWLQRQSELFALSWRNDELRLVRGYEDVKLRSVARYEARLAELRSTYPVRSWGPRRPRPLAQKETRRMPTIGPMEIIVVLVIALIILGPKRLPAAGRSLGEGLRGFKETVSAPRRDPSAERDELNPPA